MPFFKNKYRTESNRLQNWDYSSKAIYFITLVTQNRECIFGDIENKKMVLSDIGKIIEAEILKSIQIRDRWFFHNWVIMPNHIHLLIEIVETHVVETHGSSSLQALSQSRNQFPKSNYSTKTILPDDTDLELRKLFISSDAYLLYIESINKKSSITPIVNPSPVAETHGVETHGSASLSNVKMQDVEPQNVKTQDVETHGSASLQSTKPNNNLLSRKPKSISSFVALFKSVTTKQINPLLGDNESHSIWQRNYHDHIVQNCDSFDKIYYYIKNNPKNWSTDSINS